jgi:hypothetical protein
MGAIIIYGERSLYMWGDGKRGCSKQKWVDIFSGLVCHLGSKANLASVGMKFVWNAT